MLSRQTRSKRQTAGLVLGIILWVVFNVSALAGPRVALTDFAYADQPFGLQSEPVNLTSAVQAVLSTQTDFEWVERQEMDQALTELSLGLSGITDEAAAARVGSWVRADVLIRGVLLPIGEDKVALNLTATDARRAGILTMQGMLLDLDARGRLDVNRQCVRQVARVLGAMLEIAERRLETLSGKTVLAPLFFRNVGPHTRLDFVEDRLFAGLAEGAGKSGKLHALRFGARTEAEQEAELVLMGLTDDDSEAWRKVADIYVWGEFAELETGDEETPFQDVPYRIRLTFWNGRDEPVVVEKEGKVVNIARTVDAICAEVVALAEETNLRANPAGTEERLAIARALRERANRVEEQIGKSGGYRFLQVVEGKRLHAYQLKLLETACFFDPMNGSLRRLRLECRWGQLERDWMRKHPVQAPATVGDHWRRVEQHLDHLERFPLREDGSLDDALARKAILALQEAGAALNRRSQHRLPDLVAHEQKELIARLLVTEAHALNKIMGGRDPESLAVVNELIFATVYQGPFTQNADLLYLLTEELWPYLRPFYFALREKGPDDRVFQDFAGMFLSIYDSLGLTHRAVAKLEEESEGEGAVADRESGSGSSPAEPKKTTDTEWKAVDVAYDSARNFPLRADSPLVAKELLVWPKVFYFRSGFRPSRRSMQQVEYLEWHDGLLWISERAQVRFPSADGWTNEDGSYYLWAYDPANDRARNLSRDLSPHGVVTDVVWNGSEAWLAMELDGVRRWNPVTGDLTRQGVSDGMISHDMRAGVTVGDHLFFAGQSSGDAVLSRYSIEEAQWFAVKGHGAGMNLSSVQQLARFERWLLAGGKRLALYDTQADAWERLTLPNEQGREKRRDRAHRDDELARVLVEAGNDGFWIVEGRWLYHVEPRESEKARVRLVSELPGDAMALTQQEDVLWIGLDRLKVLQVSSRGTRSESSMMLVGFDVEEEKWVARLAIDDERIDHLTASSKCVWVAGSRIWQIDTHQLHPGNHAVETSWPRLLFEAPNALHSAVWEGDVATLEQALKANVDPNEASPFGQTPLLRSAFRGDIEVAETLLSAGADIDRAAPDGWFPLLAAVQARDIGFAEFLLSGGANVNNQGPPSRYRFEGDKNVLYERDSFIDTTTPPQAPVNFRAEPISSTTVRLTWDSALGNESRFIIGGTYSGQVILPGTERSYIDVLPRSAAGTEMDYVLRALNGANGVAEAGHWMHLNAEARVSVTIPGSANDPPFAYYPEEEQVNPWHLNRPRDLVILERSPLMMAAAGGDERMLQLLLTSGSDVDARDVFGDTALHYALREGRLSSARLLLEHGADINAQNHNGTTALTLEYARRTNRDFFRELLERGADPDLGGRRTPLMIAASAGRRGDVDLLLEYGADLHVATTYGGTAFSGAAAGGYRELTDLFLERGFDPTLSFWRRNKIRKMGDGALMAGIVGGDLFLIKSLLDRGMNPNGEDTGESLLHLAARKGRTEAAKLLLRYGADPLQKNHDGLRPVDVANNEEIRRLFKGTGSPRLVFPSSRTRLYHGPLAMRAIKSRTEAERTLDRRLLKAAAAGERPEVQHLLSEGAWIDTSDDEMRTPVIHALRTGKMDFIRWFLEQRPSLNVVGLMGDTPLGLAVGLGDEKLVREMLARGASPNLSGGTGTALHVAIEAHETSIARLLLDHGASPSMMGGYRNGYQTTPLMLAAGHGQVEMVQLLLDRGAIVDAYDLSFLRIGGSVGEVERRKGPNVLFWAASSGNCEMIDLLLDHGADLAHEAHGGHNALCWAVNSGSKEATAHLLSLGLKYRHPLDPPPDRMSEDILKLLKDAAT